MSAAQPPQPPAGDGSGDDPFSWLYQRGHPAPSEDEPPLVPPTVQSPTPRAVPEQMPTYAAEPPPVQPTAPPPSQPPGPPPTYVLSPYQPGVRSAPPPEPVAEPPKRRGALIGIIVAVVALAAIAAGIGVAFWLDRSQSGPDPSPQPSTAAPSSPARSGGGAIVPSGVSADCSAPSATDDAGRRVSYDAANVLDGDPNTAWRCDGEGEGKTLTFTFPAGTTISQVGLVNGYAKTDPTSGAKRYAEYRRITEVRWTFDGGSAVEQKLKDDTTTLQTISVDDVAATRVVLTIEDSSKPGSKADTRDAVLISSVSFR